MVETVEKHIMECKICFNTKENKFYEFQEMMYGYRDKFIYFQCPECGCLQQSNYLLDYNKYYPLDYYSYAEINKPISLKYFIRKYRNNYALFRKGLIGKLISKRYPNFAIDSISSIPLTINSLILDIGCGSGLLLLDLFAAGFYNLLGIDPFIERDLIYYNQLRILKKSINEVEGRWDIIMFHHSFEHMPDPIETLRKVSNLLSKDGYCVIRIPTVSSFAWEHYRENWVQLDAPRHLFLHSIKSVEMLSKKVHLDLEKVVYDSSSFQFWGSEQYMKGIPLNSERSYGVNPSKSIFSKKDMKQFERTAKNLNREKRGDQAVFYLRKTAG